jgi:microcystin degradation protein MlrC
MQHRPRILFAALFHETHCFVPDVTEFGAFQRLRGDEILARAGDGSTTDGFLDVAKRHGWEVLPTISYTATPSGTVADAVLTRFLAELEAAARNAVKDGIDGIFTVLHGAMVTERVTDPEGEVLALLRRLPGAGSVPLFGVIDLHANLTEAMGRHANALVAYRENPHTDARETSVRAAELLHRALTEGAAPRTVTRNAPVLWPPTGVATADTPMAELEAMARALETEYPEFWAVNVIAGFAFADVPEAGVAFSIATSGDAAIAERALDRLEACAVALRERGLISEPSADEVLDAIWPVSDGPVLLVEPADNIGGGSPGDCTDVLRAFLRHGVRDAAVIINDPEAVRSLADLPLGGTLLLAIGGKGSPLDQGPVTLDVTLVSRSDGQFTLENPHSHLASMAGLHIDMGPCAVVRAAGITILLTSRKTPPFDLGQLRSQGIEPTALKLIGVKAAVAHRAAYDPIARASHTIRSAGPCTSEIARLPYRRLRRPVFPIHDIETGGTHASSRSG